MAPAEPESPSGYDVAEQLILAAHRLKQFGNAQLAASRTTLPRTRLLAAVLQRPGRRMKELAAELGITGRTLTVMVDALEREGLLQRRVDPDDRRAIRLHLTHAGTDLVRQASVRRDEIWEDAVASLTPSERRQLVDLVRRLAPTGKAPHCGERISGSTPTEGSRANP